MPKNGPGSDEEAQRRLARMRLDGLDDFEAALRHAEHVRELAAPDLPSLASYLDAIRQRRANLEPLSQGRLTQRWRPKQEWRRWDESRPRASVFVDETGLTSGDDRFFPFFATVAVIVRDEDLPVVEGKIRQWQTRWFGSPRYIHELDIRRRTGPFHFNGDRTKQARAHAEYVELLRDLPYRAVAVVVYKDELKRLHPDGRIDGYLPASLYPLTVHMLFERVVHALYADGDRIGFVEAEGIGEKEDAVLLQAYAGLRLRGTRYVGDRWFRYQLADALQFYGKVHNRPGLQLADWVVRYYAEAAARLKGQPISGQQGGVQAWNAVKDHLYDGGQGRPDKFGLKVYPTVPLEQRRILWPALPLTHEVVWDPEKLRGRVLPDP